ncbi:MAG: hypothetical protein COS57_06230 [Syntrophobacterales bacterium CG03_land_8_20_14_0_80_58_14]|nr:MAG: hypothetical protein COS57_06230 [Syntrophobacterales bacterium CG03_land_8_20_14_0_80_58_14]
MAKKIRKSQEEEVILMLKKEGFKELSEAEIAKEPYKSIYALPDCFKRGKETIKSPPAKR